jgi:hypothetical protein
MAGLGKPVVGVDAWDLSDGALAKVTEEIASTAGEYDRTGDLPWPGLEVAHRAGLLTATVGIRPADPRPGRARPPGSSPRSARATPRRRASPARRGRGAGPTRARRRPRWFSVPASAA